MKDEIRFRLNGRPTTLKTDEDRTLLWVLRTDLELTGTKNGCGIGNCGSCTVIVDGRAVRSCATSLKEVRDKEVITIEGLARNGVLHPLQKAFMEHGGFQCGYCTPGMIMNAFGLLLEQPHPSRQAIVGFENSGPSVQTKPDLILHLSLLRHGTVPACCASWYPTDGRGGKKRGRGNFFYGFYGCRHSLPMPALESWWAYRLLLHTTISVPRHR